MYVRYEIPDQHYEPVLRPYNNQADSNIPAWSLHRLICLLYPREDIYPIMPTTAYDDIVEEIENEIKCGGFNKEYLKQ